MQACRHAHTHARTHARTHTVQGSFDLEPVRISQFIEHEWRPNSALETASMMRVAMPEEEGSRHPAGPQYFNKQY